MELFYFIKISILVVQLGKILEKYFKLLSNKIWTIIKYTPAHNASNAYYVDKCVLSWKNWLQCERSSLHFSIRLIYESLLLVIYCVNNNNV